MSKFFANLFGNNAKYASFRKYIDSLTGTPKPEKPQEVSGFLCLLCNRHWLTFVRLYHMFGQLTPFPGKFKGTWSTSLQQWSEKMYSNPWRRYRTRDIRCCSKNLSSSQRSGWMGKRRRHSRQSKRIFLVKRVFLWWFLVFKGPDGKFGIPQGAIDSVNRNKVGLKGPLMTPVGKGHRSLNLALRKEFNLYANVRPCRSLEGWVFTYIFINFMCCF